MRRRARTRSDSATRSNPSRRCSTARRSTTTTPSPRSKSADNIVGKRDVVQIRPQHALLREADSGRPARDSARGDQCQHPADLQHRCALDSVRRRRAVPEHRARLPFTPVSLNVRTSPFDGVNGTFRTTFDGRYSRFRNFSADASWEETNISLQASWSQVRFRPNNRGENVAAQTHYFNSNTNLRFQQNRYGLIHQFNWDLKDQSILQQRIAGYYNAQCCGFSAEYQIFDLSRLGSNTPSRRTRGSISRSPSAASATCRTSSARLAGRRDR